MLTVKSLKDLDKKIKEENNDNHLITIPAGSDLSDVLVSSPVLQGEGGEQSRRFEFGVDPEEDPELAMALRISMEEHRQREEEAARRARENSPEREGAGPPTDGKGTVNFAKMSEEEQIAYVMRVTGQNQQVEEHEKDLSVMNEPTTSQKASGNLPDTDSQSDTNTQAEEKEEHKTDDKKRK